MNIRKTEQKSERARGSIDWWMMAIVLTLLCLGLLMVLSASGVTGERTFGDKYIFFRKQLTFALVGLGIIAISIRLPRKFINALHYPALFSAFILLILCLSPLGAKVNGAQRWIPIGGFSLQPMEFAKLALVLYLGYFFSAHQELVKTFSKGVIPPFAITGVLCCLLLLQPDFGGAVILGALLFFLCYAGGTRFAYLVLSFSLVAGIGIALILNSPYRFRRLLAFLDPFKEAQDAGYQLVQSFYALGNGGIFGLGMGNSIQKMLYLPEAHNDFIMAVVGEELGLLGVTLVMILFAMLFARCYRIIMGQEDMRDRLTAFGLTLIIALGATLNLAVVMGMAPPKGVAMPFLSYGGSSLLATMCCVGLLLNYSRTSRDLS